MATNRWWWYGMVVGLLICGLVVVQRMSEDKRMETQQRQQRERERHERVGHDPRWEKATFGGGCYWCLEAAYRQLPGVEVVVSGFMGGQVEHPSYEQVCTGSTGHAEVVQVVYDPQVIGYEKLLEWFWRLHDPTTKDRQGNDIGPQYRSVIFYHGDDQKRMAEQSVVEVGKRLGKVVVTEVEAAGEFYAAPDGHQDYYFQNKSKNPYCRYVIEPKLEKAGLKH